MGLIQIIIEVILIVLVIMTAITDPSTSAKYGFAMIKSGKVLFDWSKTITVQVLDQINTTSDNQTNSTGGNLG